MILYASRVKVISGSMHYERRMQVEFSLWVQDPALTEAGGAVAVHSSARECSDSTKLGCILLIIQVTR
jgi:hypothetical protein